MGSNEKIAYLHVGLHKTGTTAIQWWLHKNKGYLKKNGLKYLSFKFLDHDCPNHSIPFYFIYSEARESYHIAIREQIDTNEHERLFKAQLKSNLRTNNNIIISGEDISKLREPEMRSLKQTLTESGFTIKTIVFVRSPYDLVHSLFQEFVKSNLEVPDLSLLLTLQRQDLQRLSNVFNRLEIISYDKSITNELGILGSFLSILNLHPAKVKITDQNRSLSQNAIRLMNHINTFEPFIIDGKMSKNRNDNDLTALRKIGGKKFRLSENEISPLKKTLEKEALFITQLTGADFSNEVEFGDDVIWDEPTVAQLENVLVELPSNLLVHAYTYFYTEDNISDELRAKVLSTIEKLNTTNFLAPFVEMLRDTALSIEPHNLRKASRFMDLAERLRPNGPFIKARNEYYKNLLENGDSSL